MNKNLYDKKFYQMVRNTAENSVVPVLKALKKYYHGEIHSAVDLGCGVGVWLRGIKEIFDKEAKVRGYDGEYVERENLVIAEEEFIAWDLKNKITDEGKYDIAISLEVAEHLPKDCADDFVESLVKLSDIVLFSAAIPNQGGTEHTNEQPLSYWINKFNNRNYEFYDFIRPCIWENQEVSFWYKQNTVVFVRRDSKAKFLMDNTKRRIVNIVHPELLRIKEEKIYKKYDDLWRCYWQVGIVRDLFDSFPNNGIAIRMGGLHTKRLLSLIGKENRKKIDMIIDSNPNCICKDEGYPIVELERISELDYIRIVVLSSAKNRNMLLNESKIYPDTVKVIDIYQFLEENKCICLDEFFK